MTRVALRYFISGLILLICAVANTFYTLGVMAERHESAEDYKMLFTALGFILGGLSLLNVKLRKTLKISEHYKSTGAKFATAFSFLCLLLIIFSYLFMYNYLPTN